MKNILLFIFSLIAILTLNGYSSDLLRVEILSSVQLRAPVGKMGARLVVEDKVLMIDSSNSSILVFDKKGNFENRFGRKGVGPGEMLNPMNLDYHQGKLIVTDTQRQGFLIFDFTEGRAQNPFFMRTGSALNAVSMRNGAAVVIGHLIKNGKMWWASMYRLEEKEVVPVPLISYAQVWNVENDTEVRKMYRTRRFLNVDPVCSLIDDTVFACEQRILKIHAYDIKTGNLMSFGDYGQYFKDVDFSEKEVNKIMSQRDSAALLKEYNRQYQVRNLIATKSWLFVLFKTPLVDGKDNYVLQRYSRKGDLTSECSLSGQIHCPTTNARRFMNLQATHDNRDDIIYVSEYVEDEVGEPYYFVYHVASK